MNIIQYYTYIYISRKLASANWSPSCFSKVLGGSNLQLCEPSQSTTPPGWFTSSLTVAQSPPWTPSACRHPTSHPQLWFCTELLFPALPKVHSDAEGGPLNLLQALVIMLATLNFLILVMYQYIIICSHPLPLQHTSPQYVGLDVRLTNTPQLQTRSSTLTKKLRSCAVPFVFSCQTLPS